MSVNVAGDGANLNTAPLIDELLTAQITALGLKKSEVVQRWGYSSIGKGLRRLEDLLDGSFLPNDELLSRLAAAVELPVSEVKAAIAATKGELEQRADEEKFQEWLCWSASFVPHAIVKTDRLAPSPIFVAAFIGPEKILRLDFDGTKPKETWITDIVKKLPEKVAAFGNVVGFYINHSPVHAVEYDVTGIKVRDWDQAKRPGKASITQRGRDIADALRSISKNALKQKLD